MTSENTQRFYFSASNRKVRAVANLAIILPLCVVFAGQLDFIQNQFLYGLALFVMTIVIMRFANLLTSVIPFVKVRGACEIQDERLILAVGRRGYILPLKDILGMDYFNANIYNFILGRTWDRLTIKTEQLNIYIMSSPDEEEKDYKETTLFDLMNFIRRGINSSK